MPHHCVQVYFQKRAHPWGKSTGYLQTEVDQPASENSLKNKHHCPVSQHMLCRLTEVHYTLPDQADLSALSSPPACSSPTHCHRFCPQWSSGHMLATLAVMRLQCRVQTWVGLRVLQQLRGSNISPGARCLNQWIRRPGFQAWFCWSL